MEVHAKFFPNGHTTTLLSPSQRNKRLYTVDGSNLFFTTPSVIFLSETNENLNDISLAIWLFEHYPSYVL